MKISVRQICFIMIVYTAVTKLILYPTFLSFIVGKDLIFSALIDFLLQCAIIWAVSFLSSKTDKTFFELLSSTFGKIIARVVYGLFAIFLISATIIPIFEQKVYVQAIFYDTLPSLLVFLPFFFFSVYVCSKDFTNIGRCADICLPLFLVSMALIIIMSVGEVNFENFLPIMKTPVTTIFSGALYTAFRFIEPCYLLLFIGSYKYKKGDSAKITLSYVVGGLITILCLVIFVGIYGDIAPSRQFAISKLSLFFPAVDLIGRVDLIALYILECVMLFALVLNIQLAVHCLSKCIGYDNKPLYSLMVNVILLLILVLQNNNLHGLHAFWAEWMWIIFIIFANLVPIFAWMLKRGEKSER